MASHIKLDEFSLISTGRTQFLVPSSNYFWKPHSLSQKKVAYKLLSYDATMFAAKS